MKVVATAEAGTPEEAAEPAPRCTPPPPRTRSDQPPAITNHLSQQSFSFEMPQSTQRCVASLSCPCGHDRKD